MWIHLDESTVCCNTADFVKVEYGHGHIYIGCNTLRDTTEIKLLNVAGDIVLDGFSKYTVQRILGYEGNILFDAQAAWKLCPPPTPVGGVVTRPRDVVMLIPWIALLGVASVGFVGAAVRLTKKRKN